MTSEKNFLFPKGMAWTACNKLDKICRSSLDKFVKMNIFKVYYYTALRRGHYQRNYIDASTTYSPNYYVALRTFPGKAMPL